MAVLPGYRRWAGDRPLHLRVVLASASCSCLKARSTSRKAACMHADQTQER